MGFGGATSAMITSLKNNNRNRKSTFNKLEKHLNTNNDSLYFENTSTQKELEKIKERIIKRNKKSLLIKATLLTILLLTTFFVIGFVNF